MREIVFVTTNKGKIELANNLLQDIKVISYEYDLIEPRGDSIRVIAESKVKQAYNKTGKPCIAMDIGFFINALNGFPRAYVNHALDTIGIEGIVKLMDGVEDRSCEFRECLAYYDGQNLELFESIGRVELSHTVRGNEREKKLSDLWFIVEPIGSGRTLAELEDDELKRYVESGDETSIEKFGNWYNAKACNSDVYGR